MLIEDERDIAALLRCPACKGELAPADDAHWVCRDPACAMSTAPIPRAMGKSIMVDFADSVLDRASTVESAGRSILPRRSSLRRRIVERIEGGNPITPYFATDIIARAQATGQAEGRRGRLLIVGGGTVGSGAEALYESADVDTVAFDVYRSDHVTFVADGHAMPFADGSFDAVWIQAVLEHVLEPTRVVAELTRVLRPGGLVFADTPFLWPVHEAAYDYTRWTPSGHRWLFHDFDVIASGVSSGPGRTALLGLRYLAAALLRSAKLAQLATIPFLWLRLLDRFCDPRWSLDACAGLFFYGTKRDAAIDPRDIIAFFDTQVALQQQVPQFARVSAQLVRQRAKGR